MSLESAFYEEVNLYAFFKKIWDMVGDAIAFFLIDRADDGNFVKLYVAGVPRTVTEEEVCLLWIHKSFILFILCAMSTLHCVAL